MNKKRLHMSLWFGILPTALGIGGCFNSSPSDIEVFSRPNKVNVSATNYAVQPPDEIEIHCARVPEIDKQRQRVRPDGKISFESIGEIQVAGKTPEQVGILLSQKLTSLYTLPGDRPIDVRVAAFQSKSYYVIGQVYMPGRKIYTGRDTLLSALADARLNPMAWKEKIQVVRPSSDPNDTPPRIFEVNFQEMYKYGDLSKDVMLEEGDIVYVPPTILASISLKLEEFLTPVTRAFSGAYIMSGGKTGMYPGGGYGGGY